MSLARAALLRPRRAALFALPRRSASTSSPSAVTEHHDEHHDDHHAAEDTTVYPPETFSNKAWRNFLLVTIGGLAFYKFAPSPEGDTWFGRTLAYWATPKDIWAKANGDHLIKAADLQDGQLILTDAKLPPVHRFRYPQAFEQSSPFVQPVGMKVDLSDLVVKTAKQ